MWGSGSDSARRKISITVRNLDAEQNPTGPVSSRSSQSTNPDGFSRDSLLRLLRSDFFDAWMAVTYLYRYRASRGVQDYICNELYHLSDADLEAFLPQICNLVVHHARDSIALERFVMDKCAESLHFAVQVYWFLQAAVEDAVRKSNKDAEARCRLLRTRCETAAVNGAQRSGLNFSHGTSPSSQPSAQLKVARSASAAHVNGDIASSPSSSSVRKRHAQPLSLSPKGKLYPSFSAGHITMRNKPSSSTSSKQSELSEDTMHSIPAVSTPRGSPKISGSKPPSIFQAPKTRPRPLSSSISDCNRSARTHNRHTSTPLPDSEGSSLGHKHSISCGAALPESCAGTELDSSQRKLFPSESDACLDDVAKAGIATTTREVGVGATLGGEDISRIEQNDPCAASTQKQSGKLIAQDVLESRGEQLDVLESKKHSSSDISSEENDAYDQQADQSPDANEKSSMESRPEKIDDNSCETVASAVSNMELRSAESCANSPSPDSELKTAADGTAYATISDGTEPEEVGRQSDEENSLGKSKIDGSPSTGLDPMILLSMKQERFDYFNDSLSVVKAFVRLSLSLRDVPQEERAVKLKAGLEDVNGILLRRMAREQPLSPTDVVATPTAEEVAVVGEKAALRSVHLPLSRATAPALRILRVIANDAVILTSRTRVPYMLLVEVLPTKMMCCDQLLFCHHIVSDLPLQIDGAKTAPEEEPQMPSRNVAGGTHSSSPAKVLDQTPAQRQRANVHKAVYGATFASQVSAFVDLDVLSPDAAKNSSISSSSFIDPEAERKMREAAVLAVYGELWSWKEERILSVSPFRNLKGLKLMPLIVKAGDDLRQEQLAIQLITQFQSIFAEESVDVYLRPFTVMSVSSDAGFMEVIPDAVSIHSLKKRTPNFVSLLDYFERAYGRTGSHSFRLAQRRFIQSMAGYSLVSYFLQIKDRHNGNIMIDAQGHIVHIDFGFMLTNSPGAIKFENVPFKLTEEYLQVICARKSVKDPSETSKTEGYRYFQELFVLGFLAARKHNEKLTTLVEIMMDGTSMPCMSGGLSVVESLRHRFSLGVSEEHCIANALALIEESRLSWRSASYDHFQKLSNGYE